MNLDIACGQLITGRLPGVELDTESRALLAAGTMSGVILFKDNAVSLEQLARLIFDIHSASPARCIVSVDEEGGAVQRFDHIITPMPSAMAVASLADDDAARRLAEISAQELFLLGINCNLAPVLDVATNPMNPIIATRAYGSSPATVARFARMAAKAYLSCGILPVGKHFPGHGDTSVDSHTDLPCLDFDLDRLEAVELAPFRAVLPELPAVLTAHIWLPKIDSDPLPSSLSPRITTGILRDKLSFNGLVFTDDMRMQAVADRFELTEAAVLALVAGADHVLVCGTAADVRAVHQAIKEAVSSGRLDERRLQSSLDRRTRALELTGGNAPVRLTEAEMHSNLHALERLLPEHDKTVRAIAREAISIVRGTLPDLTMKEREWVILVPDHPRYRLNLLAALEKLAPDGKLSVGERRFPLDPDQADIDEALTFARGKNCVFLTYKGLRHEGQLVLGRTLIQHGATGVAVATDTPEDLLRLPDWPSAAALCDPSSSAMDALAASLLGLSRPRATSDICASEIQLRSG